MPSGEARVLRDVVGLDANATLVRQAVEASAGVRAVGPAITHAPLRPDLADLDTSSGQALVAAVDAWEAGAGAGLRWPPLVAARLAAARAARPARARTRRPHRGAAAPPPSGAWPRCRSRTRPGSSRSPDHSSALTGGCHRRRGGTPPSGRWRRPRPWPPGPGASPRSPAPSPASAASTEGSCSTSRRRLRSASTVCWPGRCSDAGFGRCRDCGRVCPPWADTCERCGGRANAALRPGRRGRSGRGVVRRHRPR